ncbi:ABC transporter substrate-binding protein [Streptomyces sp. 6N223]|uniref:ABC transporter substrate-binding protein n=1 Tax=Streptomyces sp. 6N223 TaxID=3457412 RepID=UPI003FD66DB1
MHRRRPRGTRPRTTRRRAALAGLAATLLLAPLAACAEAPGGASDSAVEIVVGYQSKTINTVTAGTLLRAKGWFEQRLDELGRRDGTDYEVVWQDYDTGAPITAQMVAGKVDIGSMGDYPMLINGSRTQPLGEDRTIMVSVTGYNLRGGLNGVVVPPGSDARTLSDLAGETVSTSVGSAGHGQLVRALRQAGLPADTVSIENQQPQVGASALESGAVAAQSQFVAWPGLLVHQDRARLLYDGAALGVPTLHGVVVREPFAEERPEVMDAFLRAQLDATAFLHERPMEAATIVAEETGLPPEVVYLYNGPGGIATFDATLKPELVDALERDVPLLKDIAELDALDLDAFVDDSYLREAYGPAYEADAAATANPAAITGTDAACGVEADDPATAGELWLAGEDTTRPAATPTCLLRQIRDATAAGGTPRAAYAPDATTGTRWFADHMTWVRDPATSPEERLLPFAAPSAADAYAAGHPGSEVIGYQDALAEA